MPRRLRRVSVAIGLLAGALLLAVPRAGLAQNGLLGVYFDEAGRSCGADVAPGGTTTGYVVFKPDGATRGGITGVEFRIVPEDGSVFLHDAAPLDPNAILVGEPLGAGANLAYGTCQSNVSVALLRFQILQIGSAGSDVGLRIEPRNPPTNPTFPCPLATQCDAPVFTAVCVRPGKAVLNPSRPPNCEGGLEDAQWSRVKDLYR